MTYLGRGVRGLRVVSIILATGAAAQVLLHVLPGADRQPATFVVVVGSIQFLAAAGLGWMAWRHPATTIVDGRGLQVRSGSLKIRRIPWTDIAQVRPQDRGTLFSSVVRRAGEEVMLPGTDRSDGLWLAELLRIHDREHSAGISGGSE